MKNGYFVISLDFELLWGIFDVVDSDEKTDYFDNTINAIPEILDLFKKYKIHCTWATVGMLFNTNWEDWKRNIPEFLPDYKNQKLSAYCFGKSLKSTKTEKICFAVGSIQEIIKVPGQEIGTHTYSHFYSMETGQEAVHFEKDLEKAIEIAQRMDIKIKSLVFPRNQFKREYLEICYKLGIKNVRSNPKDWYWKDTTSNNIWVKIFRTGDAYVPLGQKSYSFDELKPKTGLPLEQKASRFLRPLESNPILRRLKLERIKKEMQHAAKNNEIYHLWWHPHNFGNRTAESLQDLKEILEHFELLEEKYSFQSSNMAEIGDKVLKNI